MDTKTRVFWLNVVLMSGCTFGCAWLVPRSAFEWLLPVYGLLFGGYVYAWRSSAGDAVLQQRYLWLGVALRLAVLGSLPNWSDDIFRFLWDGRLAVAGIHPFAYTPAQILEQQIQAPGIGAELFGRLNSPQYYSVYPPVCQAVFALAACLFRENVWGGAVVIKLFLLACDLGTVFLLKNAWKRPQAAFLYALNPLVILEICGNAHFEGAMIFFLMLALYSLDRGRWGMSALWMAFSVASKLVPLMLLPLVWRWLGWRRGLAYMLVFGGVSALLFLPLLNVEVLLNMGKSLDLYFQKFAFNASLFYVVWEIGLWINKFHLGQTVGPALGLLTLLSVLILCWRLRPGTDIGQLATAMFWASCIQLLNASTVHPWYVTLPFALGLFTRRRFALVWTGAVILSYSHYWHGRFEENPWLIAVEYLGCVFSLVF